MKCPKCSFITSNRNDVCPRCVFDLRLRKRELGIRVTNPNSSLEELISQMDGAEGETEQAAPQDHLERPQVQPQQGESKRGLLGRIFGKQQKSDEESEEHREEQFEEPKPLEAEAPPTARPSKASTPPVQKSVPKPAHPVSSPTPSARSGSLGTGGGMQMVESEEPAPSDFADSDVFQLLNTLHTPAEAFSESIEDSLGEAREAANNLRGANQPSMLRSEILSNSPTVAPTVVEFGDDSDFDGALDELLGDETTFEVTSVAVESQKFSKPKGPSWEDDWNDEEDDEDEFDFSFDDDDDDGEDSGADSIEMLLEEEPVEAAPAEEGDSFLDSLMSNLQSIEAQSTQASILSQNTGRSAAPQPSARPAPERNVENLRRAQEVLARLGAVDHSVLSELSMVLADAYGLPSETFTPPPIRPEEEFEVADREEVVERTKIREKLAKFKGSSPTGQPDDLLSLESQLHGEMEALNQGGTSFFSVQELLGGSPESMTEEPEPTVTPSEEHLLSLEADLLAELNAIQGDPNPQPSVQKSTSVEKEEMEIIEEDIDFPPAHSLLTAAHLLADKGGASSEEPQNPPFPGLTEAQDLLSQELDSLLGASGEEVWNTPDTTLQAFLEEDEPLESNPVLAQPVVPSEGTKSPSLEVPLLNDTESLLAGELESLLGMPSEELAPEMGGTPDLDFAEMSFEEEDDSEESSPELLEQAPLDLEKELAALSNAAEEQDDLDLEVNPLFSEADQLLGDLTSEGEEENTQNFESTPGALLAEFGLADEEDEPEMKDEAELQVSPEAVPSPSSPLSSEADLLAGELEALLGASDLLGELNPESPAQAFGFSGDLNEPSEEPPLPQLSMEGDLLSGELDDLLSDEVTEELEVEEEEEQKEEIEGVLPSVPEQVPSQDSLHLIGELDGLLGGEVPSVSVSSEASPLLEDVPLSVFSEGLPQNGPEQLPSQASLQLIGELDDLLGDGPAQETSPLDAESEGVEQLPVEEEKEESPSLVSEPLFRQEPLSRDRQETTVISRSSLLQEIAAHEKTLAEDSGSTVDSGIRLPRMTDSQELQAVQLDAFLSGEVSPVSVEELRAQAEASMIASGEEYDSLLNTQAPVENLIREESDILAQVTQTMRLPQVSDAAVARPPTKSYDRPKPPPELLAEDMLEREIPKLEVEPTSAPVLSIDDELWIDAEDDLTFARHKSLEDELEISVGEMSTLVQSASSDLLFQSAAEEILDPEKRMRRIESLSSGVQRKIDARELETAVLTYQREERAHRSRQAERRMRPARSLDEMKLSPRHLRGLAAVFDLLTVFGLAVLLSVVFVFSDAVRNSLILIQLPTLDDLLPDLFSAIHFMVIFWLVVRTLSILGYGAGLGGRLLKLEVVDYEGRALGPKQALLRSCAELTIPLSFGLALVTAIGKTRRTVPDLLAKTLVVERTEMAVKKDDKPFRLDLKKQRGVKNMGAGKMAPKIVSPLDGKSKKPVPPPRSKR